MPSYPDRARLKAEIVARVEAGETVALICADAAMPCAESVQVWRRGDAGFAGALDAARARWAAGRSPYPFSEAAAEAFLARVRAGETVNDLLGRPGMPSQRAYRYWRRTQGAFAEELWRLRAVRYAGHSGVAHSRWRAWDEAVADRITLSVMRGAVMRKLLAADPALPCLAVVERWRREHREWDGALRMAMRAGRLVREKAWTLQPLTPELIDLIGERIVGGASLRSLGVEPEMPCPTTLYKWVALSPAFAREVAVACHWREEFYNDQMVDICQRNGPFGLALTKRQAWPLQWRVNQLAKRPGWKRRREAVRARWA